ncbi:GNAT family N-acetyltransferase [Luteolibacter sp. Populi]|uniref:GNAT family N-acetyltransferase n=1 Tax=Luteolibacter sp. Populi TaxID=3230487 RepID=UPI0034658B1B
MPAALIIRPYREEDEIPPITAMLHAAYAPLAAMGLRYTATYQEDEVTLKRLLRGFPFVGEFAGEIVATVTLYSSEPGSDCNWYGRPEVFSFGQFGVRPDLQGRGIGSKLMRLMEDEARQKGAEELALDTAEGAYRLRDWYARCGYREVERVSWGNTNYTSVILSKALEPTSSS